MPDINTGKKYLDQEGLSYFYGKLQTQFNGKVDKETGLGLSHNDFTDALLTKLNGIAAGAEVNQNAFSKVTVDSTDINAGSKTSTLVITSGTGITLTPDAQNGSIELSTDGVPNVIETVKVNGTALVPDANKAVDVTVPTALTDLTNDSNFVQDASYVHTDNNFTTALLTKLNGIEESADVNLIESVKVNGTALSIDSNKAVDITVPTTISQLTNDDHTVKDAAYVHTDRNFTQAFETKLTGIEAGAEVNIIEGVKVNGSALTVDSTDRSVDISVPTNNNQLTNGAGYQTAAEVGTIVEAYAYLTQADAQTTYATKAEIANAYKYKGSVASVDLLPASADTGDVYDVTATGMNYAWNGTSWDALGEIFTITSITNAEIDTMMSA